MISLSSAPAVLKTLQAGIENSLGALADALWGNWLLFALVGVGVLYTAVTGFIQVRQFPAVVRKVAGEWRAKAGGGKGISSVQALLVALGSCVGSGNIVGVATALIAGGPGALFWMWAAAFFGMATKYGEIVLGVLFRGKNKQGEPIGGPMFYIRDGLRIPALGSVVAILLFIQNAGGTLIQSNVIAGVALQSLHIPTWVSGLVTAGIMIVIIRGGFRRLVRIEQKMVPFMACLYILGGIVVLAANVTSLPAVFSAIFHSAFSLRAGLGGLGGAAMRYGVARGLYSNEAGEGSAAVLHAAADVQHAPQQGIMGIAEVFVDTMILCSTTGLSILASGVSLEGANASTLAGEAFAAVFRPMGYVVYVSLLLFAFTSLMSQWFFGHISLEYLKSEKGDKVYRVLLPVAIIVGSISTNDVVWSIQDCALGLLIIPNILALILLLPRVYRGTANYLKGNAT